MSCSVKAGDEAGKCYLSLMLRWAPRKLNDPVVFHWIWFIGAINFRTGGHPFALIDRRPLLQPCLTGVSCQQHKDLSYFLLVDTQYDRQTVDLKNKKGSFSVINAGVGLILNVYSVLIEEMLIHNGCVGMLNVNVTNGSQTKNLSGMRKRMCPQGPEITTLSQSQIHMEILMWFTTLHWILPSRTLLRNSERTMWK